MMIMITLTSTQARTMRRGLAFLTVSLLLSFTCNTLAADAMVSVQRGDVRIVCIPPFH
jgi:hypothetical protein